MRKQKRHFEKSYRSVQLIGAVATYPVFYEGDIFVDKELDDLVGKALEFAGFLDEKTPGFYIIRTKKIWVNYIGEFIKWIFPEPLKWKIYGKIMQSWNFQRDYQKIMNYLYDNFTMEELNKIFQNYLNTDAKYDCKPCVDNIFENI